MNANIYSVFDLAEPVICRLLPHKGSHITKEFAQSLLFIPRISTGEYVSYTNCVWKMTSWWLLLQMYIHADVWGCLNTRPHIYTHLHICTHLSAPSLGRSWQFLQLCLFHCQVFMFVFSLCLFFQELSSCASAPVTSSPFQASFVTKLLSCSFLQMLFRPLLHSVSW